MTRRTRRVILTLALVAALLAAGGGGLWWYTQTTGYRVAQLLAELRNEPPGIVMRWLGKLGPSNPPSRWDPDEIAYDLAALGKPAVPHLIEMLADGNQNVRATGARALAWTGPGAGPAIESLMALWRNGPGFDRWWKIMTEPTLRDSIARSVPSLDEREEACRALLAIGPAALPALRRSLEGSDEDAAMFAALTLQWMGPPGISVLLATLANGAPTVRARVHRILAWSLLASEPVLVAVLQALNDPDELVRGRAEEAQSRVRLTRQTLPLCLQALKNEDRRIRIFATRLLDRADLTDKEGYVRPKRMGSGCNHRHPPGDPPPWTYLMNVRTFYVFAGGRSMPREVVRVPGQLTLAEALPVLIEGMKDEDDHVRLAAVLALQEAGPTLAPKGRWVDRPGYVEVIRTLQETGPTPMDVMARALKDERVEVRLMAAVWWVSVSDSYRALVNVTADPNVVDVRTGQDALGATRCGAAREDLVLRELPRSTVTPLVDRGLHRRAAKILKLIGPHVEPALRELLRASGHPKETVRRRAMDVLVRTIPTRRPLPAYLRPLEDNKEYRRVLAGWLNDPRGFTDSYRRIPPSPQGEEPALTEEILRSMQAQPTATRPASEGKP